MNRLAKPRKAEDDLGRQSKQVAEDERELVAPDRLTQLAEPVTQGQPYLSGSNRTLRSEVLNFHRQNQCPSRPRSAYSHRKAFSREAVKSPVEFSVHSASAVVQLPSESPRNAGQPPSLSCAFSRNRMAALLFACLSGASASSAKHVASRLSCTESKYAHPPDFICRDLSVSASDEMRSDQSPGAIVILANFTTCAARLFLARRPAGCGRARHVALTSWQGPEPGTERSPRSCNAVSDCGTRSCRRFFR